MKFEYPMEADGHAAGDEKCDGCWGETWPRRCDCGGLIHAELFEADWDNDDLTIQCELCGEDCEEEQ